MRKIPKFHLIAWCGNFEERYSFRIVLAIRPKLSWNCAFPQNFHTRKLDEISVFDAVGITVFFYIGPSWCYNKSYYYRSRLPEITWGKKFCFCFRYHTNQQQFLNIFFFINHQKYIAQTKHIFSETEIKASSTLSGNIISLLVLCCSHNQKLLGFLEFFGIISFSQRDHLFSKYAKFTEVPIVFAFGWKHVRLYITEQQM